MFMYIVNKIYRSVKTYLQLKAKGRKKMQTVFYLVTLLSVTLYSLEMTVWFSLLAMLETVQRCKRDRIIDFRKVGNLQTFRKEINETTMFMNTKKSSTYLFHGCGYFDCMYVCGPYACQVLTQITCGQWIPWNPYSYI